MFGFLDEKCGYDNGVVIRAPKGRIKRKLFEMCGMYVALQPIGYFLFGVKSVGNMRPVIVSYTAQKAPFPRLKFVESQPYL